MDYVISYIMKNVTLINFWSKVKILSPEECWEWSGSSSIWGGYGNFWNPLKKTTERAHRFIWEYYYGPIGSSQIQVLHSCDNPSCVNIYHLHLGNHQLNMREKSIRGRCKPRIGSSNPNSKLTEKEVLEIKKLIGIKTNKEIAQMFNITLSNISEIYRGKIWKHVGQNIILPKKPKRRGNHGLAYGHCKLKEEDIHYIRNNKNNFSQNILATKFGVSRKLIHNIIYNKAWIHI